MQQEFTVAFNRRQRRLQSFNQEGFWMPKYYPAEMVPIDLGIRAYKKQVNDNKRVAYYKKELWDGYNSLRHKSSS